MSDPNPAPTSGPPPNPRARRQRVLVVALTVTLILVATVGLASVVAPAPWDRTLALVMTGLLIAAPLARVAWLALRWARLGDRRYAGVAVGLLAVVAGGAALAVLLR